MLKKTEGRLYRYYVCRHNLKRGRDVRPTKSVPGGEIERFVVEQIRAIGQDPALVADVAARAREQAERDTRTSATRKPPCGELCATLRGRCWGCC